MKYLNEYNRFKNIFKVKSPDQPKINIDAICKKYNIENYTINDDGSIDVDEYIDIRPDVTNIGILYELPLKFNRVNGDFNCGYNKLTSLEDCPRYIRGGFYFQDNNITSLEGCPEYVGSVFYCVNNPIYSIVKYFIDKENMNNLIELFNYYDIIQDMNVIYDRLKFFYDGIDIKVTDKMLREVENNGYKIIY